MSSTKMSQSKKRGEGLVSVDFDDGTSEVIHGTIEMRRIPGDPKTESGPYYRLTIQEKA